MQIQLSFKYHAIHGTKLELANEILATAFDYQDPRDYLTSYQGACTTNKSLLAF